MLADASMNRFDPQASSVIFVDSPVGSGFSYAKNKSAYQTGDMKQVSDLYQFLRKVTKSQFNAPKGFDRAN